MGTLLARLRDGWLLATGTLTSFRVPQPRQVDAQVAATAMSLAPVAAIPLACVAAMVWVLGDQLGANALLTSYGVIAALALGTRALHWDGLADTADGLSASFEPARSLEVMRLGNIGPAGVLSVLLVASVQASALSSLSHAEYGWLVVAIVVIASRATLTLACVRGLPAARRDGLGVVYIGSVSPMMAALIVVVSDALGVLAGAVLGSPMAGFLAWLMMCGVCAFVILRCVRRLGGITGDVLGAAVELATAALLVTLSLGS